MRRPRHAVARPRRRVPDRGGTDVRRADPGEPSSTAAAGPSRSPGGSADRPDLAAAHVAMEVVADGLDSPLWVDRIPDGSGRLAVAEQGGKIRIVEDGRLLPDPYLDITDRVLAGRRARAARRRVPARLRRPAPDGVRPLLGPAGDTTIAAFDAPAGSTTLDPGTGRILLTADQPYANHNGGWIGFDQTGMLLIALGDGGAGGDPENRASNLGEPLGKILRIDVLNPGDGPYAIPPDNPFVDRAGARPEVLHYGLRNPFRDSIDPATGDLWIGDVGQGAWEEVDVAPADARGLDFGWRRWEGSHCYDPPTGCDPTGVTMPVTEYPHTLGCAIIGGVVYHGDAIPALRGRVSVLRQLLRDAVGDRRRARTAAGADHAARDRSVDQLVRRRRRGRGGADRPGRRAGEAGARLVLSRRRPETLAPRPQAGCKRRTDFVDRRMIVGRSPCAGERPTGWSAHACTWGRLGAPVGSGPTGRPRATRPSAAPVREPDADRARRSSSAASCSWDCSWC